MKIKTKQKLKVRSSHLNVYIPTFPKAHDTWKPKTKSYIDSNIFLFLIFRSKIKAKVDV